MKGEYGDETLASVRWHVANYWDIRRAVVDKRLELKKREDSFGGGGHSAGHVSDPTAKEAIIDLQPLKRVLVGNYTVDYPEAWISAITRVLNGISKEDRKLIEVSFWQHRPRGSHSFIYDELHLAKNTYYRRKDKLMALFAIEAASAGLVSLPFVPAP